MSNVKNRNRENNGSKRETKKRLKKQIKKIRIKTKTAIFIEIDF
jgi:hypothetical protein